jgi:prevent-host-death family protein
MYLTEMVGVAQLRQNLSEYLRRIENGERFVVRDRNRPVAALGPLAETARDKLIAEGRLLPAERRVRAWEPVRLSGDPRGLSRALDDVRGE